MVESMPIRLPYVILSTRICATGEMEKRVLTPFGLLDMTFRAVSAQGSPPLNFQIEVNGDTDHWIPDERSLPEFREALEELLWGMALKHVREEALSKEYIELVIRIKGARIHLGVPQRHVEEENRAPGLCNAPLNGASATGGG